jgi:hypothetical protein
MRTFIFFALVASAGCLRKTEYKCTESTQCGAGGQCEDTGFCSFADSSCDSGRKYGEFSGSTFSNECVGGMALTDGGVDGTPGDGMMDGSTTGCPGTYSTTIGTHKYRKITAGAWSAQVTACAADGSNAYLAVPNDQSELTAIIAASNVAITWVGYDDQTTENAYVAVRGAAINDQNAMWDSGNNEPDNMPSSGGGQADCVTADMGAGRLADDKCGDPFPAVCECEP